MNKLLYPTAIIMSVLLAGCIDSDTQELDAWMKEVSVGMRGQVEPLPPAEPYTPFIYQASNLMDPFSPAKLAAAKQKNSPNAPDETRPRQTLENFDLDKLSMVGALQRNGITYGLIKTPDNAIYRVQPGNYMGRHFGKITKISESEIELSETIEDLNGEWVQKSTTMYLEEQPTQSQN